MYSSFNMEDKSSQNPLSLFHQLVREWFEEEVGSPTDVQAQAWPQVAEGKHLLVTAPTGSGKTLAAFLWALNRIVIGDWPSGAVRVVYVSPLKALNNDVRKNLITPLNELRERFAKAGEPFPDIRVQTRSGDTPQSERTAMIRRPPDILITTPESLNIMITASGSRELFRGIATVILDEIHAVVGEKRGTHLITAVERLTLLSGEFQRIALSATVRPLDEVASFIGGFTETGGAYRERKVSVVRSRDRKEYRVTVRFPEDAADKLEDDSWWPALVDEFRERIHENRSTLLFANSRRLTEKVTRLINEKEGSITAYSHHGSLSKEIRYVVEQKLKEGKLKAIVATASLELGIDVGDLDSVILVQSPFSISSALQRVGRAGHSVGEVSRGIIYPTHGRDFLDAALIARAVADQDIEEIRPVERPLDVLAQVILSMTSAETWNYDELYRFLKTCWPYRNLTEKQYSLVVEMLTGRYADSHIRELNQRLSHDRIDGTLSAKKGTRYFIYMSGGTIPDRGYYDLRLRDTKAKIGELDEEFVWERSIGDTFSLGNRTWRIQGISHNDVEVAPTEKNPGIFPFWKADQLNRDFHFSEKIGTFLETADPQTGDETFAGELKNTFFMDESAAAELVSFLNRQKEMTGVPLPHRRHLVIEHYDDPLNRSDTKQVILHTIWGGRVNRPFALALQAAWEEAYQYRLEVFAENDCVAVILPHSFDARDILSLITADNVEEYIRMKLGETGLFGARFRESAGRALLLPKGGMKKRLPLWLNRLRSRKLLQAVSRYGDFPMVLETWRECLNDDFDIPNLKKVLDELQSGEIRVSECVTDAPSPFAGNLIYRQINKYMYEDDEPGPGAGAALSDELVKEVADNALIRPQVPPVLVDDLESRLKRTAPGYAPDSPEELRDWAVERLLIPEEEWELLMEAVRRDHETGDSFLKPVRDRVARITLPVTGRVMICAVENLPWLAAAFPWSGEELAAAPVDKTGDAKKLRSAIDTAFSVIKPEDPAPERFLVRWLQYYGPVKLSRVRELFGFSPEALDVILSDPDVSREVIIDEITRGAGEAEVCLRENLEILLRMLRRTRQPSFSALPIEDLQLFLAGYHGITSRGSDIDTLKKRLEQLLGYPARAELWEEYILPARLSPYYKTWLDSLYQESDLIWFGCGTRRAAFSFQSDLDLFRECLNGGSDPGPLVPLETGRYSALDLAKRAGIRPREAVPRIWDLAWEGWAANDTFASLRNGIIDDFSLKETPWAGRRRHQGRGLGHWQMEPAGPGSWFRLDYGEPPGDLIEEEEIKKDRVRLLLDRYGILFRELLTYELPEFQWKSLFRTMRLMELSGELVTGHFFEGIPGLQFMSPESFRRLRQGLDRESVWWMNAADPVSLCGVKLEGLKAYLPARKTSNFCVFRGANLAIVIGRNGKSAVITVPPDDPRLGEYLSFYRELTSRDFDPVFSLTVEEINGVPARESEYGGAFTAAGFRSGYRGFDLERRYR